MADEESNQAENEDVTPPAVSSHDPLPLPPEISYTRPTLGQTSRTPSASPTVRHEPGARQNEGRGGAGFTKLGSGLAASTTFVASVIAGLLIGQWIDHRWTPPGSTPWGTLIFALLGVAAGFLNLFRVLAATDRKNDKK